MESLSTTKLPFSLPYCLVLFCITTTLLNQVQATKVCRFPAIFNFGDSNSDTGGFDASLFELTLPYGQTYFHRPAGRGSDGRLIIDFIAQSFGLPYLSAYLDSLEANFTHGANFAAVASTILPPPSVMPVGRFSPFYLDMQYSQFTRFIPRTQFISQQGGVFASLVPKEEYFGQALYTFDIGQNDLNAGVFTNKTVEQINASIPEIISAFSTNVKNIYNLGGRSYWIHNTGPFGCLPDTLTKFSSIEKDASGCAKSYNELAQNFNHKLKEAVVQLRKDLPLAAITYVDVYSVKYSLISDAQKYGFEKPLVACCGYGGEYKHGDVRCGNTVTVNGTEIFVGSCENPSTRISWDGVHYTEAANKVVFEQISSGAFSDPPLPLNKACYRNHQ
ncbi:esterase-like [Neltuma alba]|uniref:esterase-like n=1 Tax=Neltuma alba TaxID=207710 RepID=UPI0010A457DC|nr:esterase-like [Prosopis alba]